MKKDIAMEFNLAGVHPFIVMPTHRDIPPPTFKAMLETQNAMNVKGISLSLNMEEGCSLIHHARTRAAAAFIASPCTHMFSIDSDLVWTPDDFLTMLALGTKMECVTAAYAKKADKPEFYIRYKEKRIKSNEYGCVAVEGMPMGFSIIQRKVIEELSDKAPKRIYADKHKALPRVFRCDDDGNGYERGEDYALCADLIEAGYDINMNPNITLGHIGAKTYKHSVWNVIQTVKDDGTLDEVGSHAQPDIHETQESAA
jgi:hypothetical protein